MAERNRNIKPIPVTNKRLLTDNTFVNNSSVFAHWYIGLVNLKSGEENPTARAAVIKTVPMITAHPSSDNAEPTFFLSISPARSSYNAAESLAISPVFWGGKGMFDYLLCYKCTCNYSLRDLILFSNPGYENKIISQYDRACNDYPQVVAEIHSYTR